MSNCWSSIYRQAFFRDASVCGFRLEISLVFLGDSDGAPTSLQSCLSAVRWLFEDPFRTFQLLSTETSKLFFKPASMQDLFYQTDQHMQRCKPIVEQLLAHSNSSKPSKLALEQLCEVHNALGCNGGTGYVVCLRIIISMVFFLPFPFRFS
jgi:hypothetical protein